MTTTLIPERIMMNEGVKTARFTSILRLKTTVGPAPALRKRLLQKVEFA